MTVESSLFLCSFENRSLRIYLSIFHSLITYFRVFLYPFLKYFFSDLGRQGFISKYLDIVLWLLNLSESSQCFVITPETFSSITTLITYPVQFVHTYYSEVIYFCPVLKLNFFLTYFSSTYIIFLFQI